MAITDFNQTYFAAKEATETASILSEKANAWYNQLHTNGYLDTIKESWCAYYGSYYQDTGSGHKIFFGGEQGELTQIAVNHYRNIARNILVMVTTNRPNMQARASNTDYKSLVQTRLANNLLDYYMREKRLEKFLEVAVESAVVMGSGYIKMDWNATTGEIYDVNPETGAPIYEGDVVFTNLSPLDVVFDTNKESDDHDWVIARTFKNKFDVAAKFPEMKDRILKLPTKSDLYSFSFNSTVIQDKTEDIPIYEFYHKQTEAMPDGRYMMYLDKALVVMDTPMPYRKLPVYRMAPSNILGTPFGYTDMFDLLPIQDAVNSLYSTILSNQAANGVQNIAVPRGSDIVPTQLAGGLNIIEFNPQAGPPTALNLTQTPNEIFKFLEMLVKDMETVSGVSSVARGNPEASLDSGTALAMIQSMTLQFISGLQRAYVMMIEDLGTGLINMLKDFATVPRVAMIAGKSQKSYLDQMFTGDDLSQVNRVIVDVGNPLASTTAGKLQIAKDLLQYSDGITPEQFLTVLSTGNLQVMTEYTQNEMLLIRAENEKMAEGIEVIALAVDDHPIHIKEHKGVLSDPDLRMDPQLVQLVMNHIQEHITLARDTDPGLLAMLGIQPLGPIGGSPPVPGAPVTPTAPAPMGDLPPEAMGMPPGSPAIPTPPPPFEQAAVLPAQQALPTGT